MKKIMSHIEFFKSQLKELEFLQSQGKVTIWRMHLLNLECLERMIYWCFTDKLAGLLHIQFCIFETANYVILIFMLLLSIFLLFCLIVRIEGGLGCGG